jgi:hypothetical protein
MKKQFLLLFAAVLILSPLGAMARGEDQDQKLQSMDKQLKALQQQVQDLQEQQNETAHKWPSWVDIEGDYRLRVDSLRGGVASYNQLVLDQNGNITGVTFVPSHDVTNKSLFTNRFGLNVNAHPMEDIYVRSRLLMYKIWGHETENPIIGPFFADRAGIFDGDITHVPGDNALRVDYAFVTWRNIAGQPVWFSVGRRPSTGGVPSNLRENTEKLGSAGIPSIMVDYAFDGLTLGYAPDIEALPDAYVKFCYGKGFDSGFRSTYNSLDDVQMIGFNAVPYNTDDLHIELQYNRAISIFDNLPDAGVKANLGDIDQFGGVVMGKVLGELNLFASAAASVTHPNGSFTFHDMAGLLNDAPSTASHTGYAYYVGGRYDLPTGTKIGAEYNWGSKNWITFAPAADDIWTSKVGTRGSVYEGYVIQELKLKPISKYAKTFFRLGYQYYDFKYTGSNNWVGASREISTLASDPTGAQILAPVKHAQDIYLTFEVKF